MASLPSQRIRRLGAALFVLGAALFAGAAHAASSATEARLAYIDPGIGSFVIQALLAIAAGVAVTVRSYRNKILGFFGRKSEPPRAETPPAPVATREDE